MNNLTTPDPYSGVIDRLLTRYRGRLMVGTTEYWVDGSGAIASLLEPNHRITLVPQGDRFTTMTLGSVVVGCGWVPPVAKFCYWVDDRAIATLEIVLGTPRFILDPDYRCGGIQHEAV